jgi:virulence factor Mce-like protein
VLTPKNKIYVNLVVVVLLAVVMVSWVLLRLISGAIGDPFTIKADFAASGGVFTNQEVTYRGVLIGQVGGLELNEDGVDIELLIDPEWAGKIPADVHATVQSKSAVGEQFVNLTPNSSGGEVLEEGDVIARESTSLPVDFQELLTSLDSVLSDVEPEVTRRVIQNLAGGLGGRSSDIATILRSLGTLSDAFADVAPEQRSLLRNAPVAARRFLETKEQFAAALAAADEVFAGLGDEPEEVQNLFAQNDRFARAGIDLLAKHGRNLGEGIRALAEFNEFQLRNRAEVVQSLEFTPQFMKAIEDASVPWRSPDGREFYRIRVGIVQPNPDLPSSWPCKYKRPFDYTRLPHVRKEREVQVGMNCLELETPELSVEFSQALREFMNAPGTGATYSFDGTSSGLLGWPAGGAVTSYYGPRWGRQHTGIDIDGVAGDPIRAAADGMVVSVEEREGYGNLVVIDHGDGLTTWYAHLSGFSVLPGQEVVRGQEIGGMGCTGTCTGDHLHFEVRVDGVPVNPLTYLPAGPLFPALAWDPSHAEG